jgi:hypothetical protein
MQPHQDGRYQAQHEHGLARFRIDYNEDHYNNAYP